MGKILRGTKSEFGRRPGHGGTFSYRVFFFFLLGGSTSKKAPRVALMRQREGRDGGAHYLKQSHKEQKA